MFSTFLHGWPAAGLLLLRAAAGVVLIIQGVSSFGSKYESFPLVGIALLTITVGALLLIGFLTRFAGALAVLAAAGSMFSWFPARSVGLFENGLFETRLFETRIIAGLVVVIAVAVVCLGPGAFSVDARLFGRREIIIPSKDPGDFEG